MDNKYIYKNEQTDEICIHESSIKCIRFNKNEMIFFLDWTQGYGSFVIRCLYPEQVEYNFTTIDQSVPFCHSKHLMLNRLEITDFSYLKDDEGFIIQFNFDSYPIGYIRLHCMSFFFETPSLPITCGYNAHRIPWDPLYDSGDESDA